MPASTSRGPVAPEIPLLFESGGRPLYGVFHTPARARAAAPVLVQCHGLGVEQIALYRVEVLNARAMAAAGIPVLRYHARGHGDSSGDFATVTLETLVEDALAAAAEARARSGAAATAWLGIRFGALVAAHATRRDASSSALALWEPAFRPPDYFRGMLRGMLFSQVAEGRKPDATVDELLARLERDGRVDVHGYFLHHAVVDSSRDEDLTRVLSAWRGPTLLAQIQNRAKLAAPADAIVESLQAAGVPVTTLLVRDEPGWHFTQNPAWECEPLVRGTTEWLNALA